MLSCCMHCKGMGVVEQVTVCARGKENALAAHDLCSVLKAVFALLGL